MDPAVDPFHPLIRLLERYRRDVHSLAQPASEEAIRAAERHLGHRLPLTISGFLRRWNGGSLFRGALRLRASSELASPRSEFPGLVAFADIPGGRQWAYAPDGSGDFVFGEVTRDGLVPLHDRFDRWLKATLRMFDEDALDREIELGIRRECDPDGGHLLLALGERALASGEPSEALERFNRATATDPGLIKAWQRLGEMHLQAGDRSQARFALLKALRASRLPLPYPGASSIDPDALRTLAGLFDRTDPAWRRELESFLGERVSDLRASAGLELFQAATVELGRALSAVRQRREARSVYIQACERAKAFAFRGGLERVLLALAGVELSLGLHDEAEKRLRPLRGSADAELLLARLITVRQEPWAEDQLARVQPLLTRANQRAEVLLLQAERHLLHERLDEAASCFRQADLLAVEAGSAALQAQVCLGLGDVARLGGDHSSAAGAYRAAAERAKESHDEELRWRVVLREGDLLRAEGRVDEAGAAYQAAVGAYAGLQLPLREAWARLRVASVAQGRDREEAIRLAREFFTEPGVQLVCGVGACDALAGDPGASLAWHLECASGHARARYEAQRARPPLTRADADRPERRLGSHRIAIGAADVGVVHALSAQLAELVRNLGGASARASDPAVTTYLAAVDLLATHRSYEASEVLLAQLLEERVPDICARALRGALARSPNAALVDGLLGVVEEPGEPLGVAAAVEILGWRRERAAVQPLRGLLKDSRPVVRRAAVVALGRIGEASAVEDLLDVLQVPELEEDVAIALLLLGDRRGVDFHGQALSSGQELANPPGEIVGRYGGPSYLLLLMGAAGGDGARAAAALQGLGYLGDVRAVPRLLMALSNRDRGLLAVACGALELILGHREDPDEPGVHMRWERWWEENAHSYQEGLRYRDGEPLSARLLVKRLGHDDALVRRGAYDELVISTGSHLPFDADGPWRVQLAHRRAWKAWALEHAQGWRPGTWMFDGRPIG
jgi:HEAT repeat protein